jgi:hypothetical protein
MTEKFFLLAVAIEAIAKVLREIRKILELFLADRAKPKKKKKK